MSDDSIPDGWARATLRDVVAPSKAKIEPNECPTARYLSLEHIEGETARIIDYGTGADVASTKSVFEAGDVLYGKLRPYLNKVCVPSFDGICSTDILVFPKSQYLDSRFLLRFLMQRSVVEHAHHHSVGVQLPRVSFDRLAEIDFPIPPLAEQRRIVAKVEELLARVNAARERLAKAPTILKRFRQSVLAAACSGQLTADWRDSGRAITNVTVVIAELRHKHQAKGSKKARSRKGANAARNEGDDAGGLDLSLMPDLPETWAYARADEVVEPGTVVTYGIVLPGPQVEDGVPYVRGLDIENGRVLVDQLWRTTEAIAQKHERSRLEPGDVLLCIIRHLKVAIVPETLRGGNLTQGTVRLRPSFAILGNYLARYLESPIAQSWLKSRYFGMDMPRVNVEDARAIPIPLPPIEEQTEIVRRVEALLLFADKIESHVQAATARVEKITQAILSKAFRGDLVPTEAELARQDNRDYEPASELLRRVKTQRETSDRSPHPRRVQQLRFEYVARDLCLLLDQWGKAVSIHALEPALTFMQQPALRIKRAAKSKKRVKTTPIPVTAIPGIDLLYQRLVAMRVIKSVGQTAYKLIDKQRITNASTTDRDRAAKAIEKLSKLMKDCEMNEAEARIAVATALEKPYEVGDVVQHNG